ncbi:MAG TPA: glycosyltransferase family 39 protein, partial [Candidatus Saccharimonadales bacterium]|nr:glycosyltransferase family 39 protein [Candidatus Saccharimonadales bacterium]
MSDPRTVSAGRYPGPAPAEPGDLPEPPLIRLLLWAILAVALLARGLQAGEGLPYIHSWDEPLVAGRALVMMKTGNLNPDAFVYGTLPTYMDLVTDVFHYLWLMSRPASHPPFLASLDDVKTGFDSGWLWYVSHPSFYLWDRWLAALMGTGTVLMVYLIGRRIAGRWAGLAGAALLAGTAFHVEESAIGTVDNPMTFFVALAAWAAVAFVQEGRAGLLLTSLVACGLAVSSKLTGAVSLLLPAAALALAGGKLPGARRRLAWLAL